MWWRQGWKTTISGWPDSGSKLMPALHWEQSPSSPLWSFCCRVAASVVASVVAARVPAGAAGPFAVAAASVACPVVGAGPPAAVVVVSAAAAPASVAVAVASVAGPAVPVLAGPPRRRIQATCSSASAA